MIVVFCDTVNSIKLFHDTIGNAIDKDEYRCIVAKTDANINKTLYFSQPVSHQKNWSEFKFIESDTDSLLSGYINLRDNPGEWTFELQAKNNLDADWARIYGIDKMKAIPFKSYYE